MRTAPRVAGLFLAACLAISGCGGDGSDAAKREAGCKDEVTVEATVLPGGFSKDLVKGAGGGKETPKDTIAYHWAASGDRYIDMFRGGHRNKVEKGAARFTILGQTGRLGNITGGLGARVKLGRGNCTRYQFEAFGVSADDFKKVLTGLERTPGASPDE